MPQLPWDKPFSGWSMLALGARKTLHQLHSYDRKEKCLSLYGAQESRAFIRVASRINLHALRMWNLPRFHCCPPPPPPPRCDTPHLIVKGEGPASFSVKIAPPWTPVDPTQDVMSHTFSRAKISKRSLACPEDLPVLFPSWELLAFVVSGIPGTFVFPVHTHIPRVFRKSVTADWFPHLDYECRRAHTCNDQICCNRDLPDGDH